MVLYASFGTQGFSTQGFSTFGFSVLNASSKPSWLLFDFAWNNKDHVYNLYLYLMNTIIDYKYKISDF